MSDELEIGLPHSGADGPLRFPSRLLHKFPRFKDYEWVLNSPTAIFWVAFLIRLIAMRMIRSYHIPVALDHISFGYEMGRVARSIGAGKGFSSPYWINTGPTAWYVPVYPLMLAGIFKIFGTFSRLSLIVTLGLNCLFSGFTALTIFGIAKHTVGRRTALWSAWVWALFPYNMQWALNWIWDTSISAFLLSLAFYWTLRLRGSTSWKQFAVFGLIWGLVANTNPTLLVLLPVSVLWLFFHQRALAHRSRNLLICLALVIVTSLPWCLRNYAALGYFGLRDNFGEELYLGNHLYAQGYNMFWAHPLWNPVELENYRREGEIKFIQERKKIAGAYIASHPGEFAINTLRRIGYFWSGSPDESRVIPGEMHLRMSFLFTTAFLSFWGCLRMRRMRVRGWSLFFFLLLLYPGVFYITHTNPRYRHPIEPEMTILIVYLFCSSRDQEPVFLRSGKQNRDLPLYAGRET